MQKGMHDTEPMGTDRKYEVWNYEAMMERMLQNTYIADKIIKLFLVDVPVQLEKLKEAIGKDDSNQIRLYSHAIKGAASNLGGEAMRAAAASIEEHAIKEELKSIKPIYPILVARYRELEKRLTSYIDNLD